MMKLVELIWVKALLNLRREASINYLSYLWWILEPMMHMVIYYVVFSFLLKNGTENYVAFLLTGLIPWLWFSKTINHATGSIIQGRQLMSQVHIPKIFFPMVCLLQDSVKQAFVFMLLLIFLLLYGIQPSVYWLGLFPVVFVQLLVTVLGTSLVAVLIPFVRDLKFLVPTILQFVMFCSGLFYNYERISPKYRELFFLNPIALLLKNYRDLLMNQQWPDWFALIKLGSFSLIGMSVVLLFYRKVEFRLIRIVQE